MRSGSREGQGQQCAQNRTDEDGEEKGYGNSQSPGKDELTKWEMGCGLGGRQSDKRGARTGSIVSAVMPEKQRRGKSSKKKTQVRSDMEKLCEWIMRCSRPPPAQRNVPASLKSGCE